MEDKNVINQNNVKPTLTTNEKKRFHQVSENFLKGSREFMMEFHQSIIKSVDTKYINNKFIEEYQEQLNEYKKNVEKTVEDVREEKAKKSIWNNILNFIIICEVGLIGFALMPEKMKKIGSFALKIIDGICDEIKKAWDGLDFSKTWDSIQEVAGEYITPVWEFVLEQVHEFFNAIENNVFLKCFVELAKSIIHRGKGPIQWMLQFAYSFLAKKGLERPKIKHWLIYGPEVYKKVEALNNETFDFLENTRDTSSSFFGHSNAEIGVWEMEDGEMTWKGLDEGHAFVESISKELEDVKDDLDNHAKLVQRAAEETSQAERVERMYGMPNLFNSSTWKVVEENWKKIKKSDGDLQGQFGSVTFEDMQINLASHGDNTKELKKLHESYTKVYQFYNKYNSSSDPFAKQICKEVRDKLGPYVWNGDGTRVPIPVYMFAPTIYYAILQYEVIQSRNEKAVASLNRDLNRVNSLVERYLLEESKDELDDLGEDVKAGRLELPDYVKTFIDYLKTSYENPHFSFLKIDFDVQLGFIHLLFDTIDTIQKGFDKLKGIFTNEKKYQAISTIEVTDKDIKQFQGEIQVGNDEALVKRLVTNSSKLRANIKRNYLRRTFLLTLLEKEISENVKKNG